VPAGLRDVTAIAGGYAHSLALKSDGAVVAWGANGNGQSSVPVGLSSVVAVAAGDYHSLVLKRDGTVAAWGRNNFGQANVPAGLSGVAAIAAGGYHSLVLKRDGTVAAWGWNGYGQSSVPAGLSGVVAVAAGSWHSLALKRDGTVVAWGQNDFGQRSVPAGLRDVIAIAAGAGHSLALKSDGAVVAWGDNNSGQSSVPAGLSGVAAIAAGEYYSLALKRDGTVVAWGQNDDGQTSIPAGLYGVTAIAAGSFHSMALAPTDTTPPAISADLIGTLGSDGWYTSDVLVGWSVVDDESPRTAQPGCDSQTLSSDTAGTSLSCAATSAGGSSSASVTVKRDATPPSTSSSVSSAATEASVTLTANDALSGVAATSYRVNGGALQPYSGPIGFTIAGAYTVDYFSTDQAGNIEAAQTLTFTVNAAPAATADRYIADEDTPLNTAAPGVLGNDGDADAGDTTTAVLLSGPSHAVAFALKADGSFSYTPAAQFNGDDSFTYQARDTHGAVSTSAMVTIAVAPVNDVPVFAAGPNVTTAADAGPYSAAWATALTPGPADESGQALTFVLTNNNATLFSSQPAIAPDGALTFTPAPNRSGSATVTVVLKDNGGTENGGLDSTPPQTFRISITPAKGTQSPGYWVYLPRVTR
jgi:hypothetical protein